MIRRPAGQDPAWELKATRRELERAKVELATVRAENRRLRKVTKRSKGGHLLERAAGDARQIVAWRAAGYSVTRRNCESYGMSRRRWVWAVGLLKLARVLGDQVASADTFLLEDVEECAEAIERAVRAVESRGLETLIMRLPKGAAKMPMPQR
ncbi:MAG: hypothetical protein U0X20_21980 [Caldilineaceae bacterium]